MVLFSWQQPRVLTMNSCRFWLSLLRFLCLGNGNNLPSTQKCLWKLLLDTSLFAGSTIWSSAHFEMLPNLNTTPTITLTLLLPGHRSPGAAALHCLDVLLGQSTESHKEKNQKQMPRVHCPDNKIMMKLLLWHPFLALFTAKFPCMDTVH